MLSMLGLVQIIAVMQGMARYGTTQRVQNCAVSVIVVARQVHDHKQCLDGAHYVVQFKFKRHRYLQLSRI